MDYTIEITFEGDHILAQISGEDSYEVSYDMLSKIVEACDEYGCYNVLSVANLTPLSVGDAYDHPKIFRDLQITSKHRIAWVEKNEDTRKVLDFCVMVLRNRGMFNGGIFADVSEAKQWLLGDQAT